MGADVTKPKSMRKRPGAVGNRATLPNFYPHPKAKPCRRCNMDTDPQDMTYTAGKTASEKPLCIACLRVMETERLRQQQAPPTYLAEIQRQVEANPELLKPDYTSPPK